MGVVYEAYDKQTGRKIVVKVLRNAEMPWSVAKDYFLREALMVSYLKHPNIVDVFDFGPMGAHPYIAMELVKGKDLGKVLKATPNGMLDIPNTLHIARQTAAALDYAHSHDVIHRDVKPGNIIVTETGDVKLLDFGLATALRSLQKEDQVVGTPLFMAPELIRQGEVDHRVDIYALGILLFRMLTGRYPFTGGAKVLAKHLRETPPDPVVVNPQLPMLVGGPILKCIEKDPNDRYDSAGAAVAALESAAGL